MKEKKIIIIELETINSKNGFGMEFMTTFIEGVVAVLNTHRKSYRARIIEIRDEIIGKN